MRFDDGMSAIFSRLSKVRIISRRYNVSLFSRFSFYFVSLLNITAPHLQLIGEIAPSKVGGEFIDHSIDLYKNEDLPENMENIKKIVINRRNDTYAELYFNGTLHQSDLVVNIFL